jgi:hypothetical protein
VPPERLSRFRELFAARRTAAGSRGRTHSGGLLSPGPPPLKVLAAPYHRNNHGNRAALDILRAPPALAESLARKSGATYVMLCSQTPADRAYYRFLAPDSLAASLAAGQTPAWLRPVPVAGTPFQVFAVLPPRD